jgi:hypothetical protein
VVKRVSAAIAEPALDHGSLAMGMSGHAWQRRQVRSGSIRHWCVSLTRGGWSGTRKERRVSRVEVEWQGR